MIARVLDASRTLGKLKVFCQAAMSRALNAAMKSSRHCIAAADEAAFFGLAVSGIGGLLCRGSEPPYSPPRAARGQFHPARLSLSFEMFQKAWAALLAAFAVCIAAPAIADEGMWPFDEAPVARVKDALGVTLDSHWLDHLRDASVRLSDGCSASIVSRGGLVLTNQHCVVACAQQISGAEHDYVADGFVAAVQADERTCPGVQAEVLAGITDVTHQIFAAGFGKTGEAFATARELAIAETERDACHGDPRYRCQVISFYDGGEFKLYRYRRYADVRLVFAPELDAAFFGGDPDNFNFPRYDLDCAFLRLYERGKPAATPNFLAWSTSAPSAGEPVFVSGNPATTERQLTLAQLGSLRDITLPILSTEQAELRVRLHALSDQSPAMRRAAAGALFINENTLKVIQGRLAALKDADFLAARAKDETELKARLAADPKFAAEIGDPWTQIEATQKAYQQHFAMWHALEQGAGGGSELFRYARVLVRGAAERAKPTGQRLPEFAVSRLASTEKMLLDDKPIEPALEKLQIGFWLSKAREQLGVDAPATALLVGQERADALAERLVAGSKLADPAVRRALW